MYRVVSAQCYFEYSHAVRFADYRKAHLFHNGIARETPQQRHGGVIVECGDVRVAFTQLFLGVFPAFVVFTFLYAYDVGFRRKDVISDVFPRCGVARAGGKVHCVVRKYLEAAFRCWLRNVYRAVGLYVAYAAHKAGQRQYCALRPHYQPAQERRGVACCKDGKAKPQHVEPPVLFGRDVGRIRTYPQERNGCYGGSCGEVKHDFTYTFKHYRLLASNSFRFSSFVRLSYPDFFIFSNILSISCCFSFFLSLYS